MHAGRSMSHLPLGNLEGTLILADLQQLDDALLIRGHACHLSNNIAHHLHLLSERLWKQEVRQFLYL